MNQLIRRHTYVRGLAGARGEQTCGKEWLHFCILGEELDIIVNYSVMRDLRPAAHPGAQLARLILLVRTQGTEQGGWIGGIDEIASDRVDMPGFDLCGRLGASSFAFRDGCFEIQAALESGNLAASFRLVPETSPVIRRPFVKQAMSWALVPRLSVQGTVTRDGRTTAVSGVAYHDHNWGTWLWGQDCVWQWGFILPTAQTSPYTVLFVRLSDRRHQAELSHEVLLWRHDELVRVFRTGEVSFRYQGTFRRPQIPKFPGVMRLVAPELTTDLPAVMEVTAVHGLDTLTCRLEIIDVAQIIVPSEVDLGVTFLNECIARSSVTGTVAGESFTFAGRTVLEYLTVEPG